MKKQSMYSLAALALLEWIGEFYEVTVKVSDYVDEAEAIRKQDSPRHKAAVAREKRRREADEKEMK